ncbi:MAG: L-rhamnose mutarotase [Clostridia bacterium]|nr:L-rhamnose mutarotase [Clostridia bacterium]
MEKYAWKATIKDGSLEEYIRRHDNLPQDMKDLLREAGICNYTIWNVGNELFGYYECKNGVEFAAKTQNNSPIVAKWDAYMADILIMEKDPITGAQPLLKQVFEFD